MFSNLNVPIAEHKVEGLVQSITFLGISLDTGSKLSRIRSVINAFTRSQVCIKKQLQSLLGMLNSIIPQGRSFISLILVFLSQAQDPHQILRLDQAATADLAMWDKFLENWNVCPCLSQ